MSKPNSFKVQPWTAFPRDTYSILTDDFVHEKLLTVKVAAKSSRGTVNLKNQIVAKGQNFQSSGEIKAWFPVWNNGVFYLKSVNKQIKFHYDHGVNKYENFDLNLYGSYQMLKQNNTSTLKLGAMTFFKNFELDNRIRFSHVNPEEHHVSTGHKISFKKDKWSLTAFEVDNWDGGVLTIARNALRIGYKQNDQTSWFLRAAQNSERKFSEFEWLNPQAYFNYFALNVTHKINDDVTLAGQVDFTASKLNIVTALVSKNLPQRNAWIKLRGQRVGSNHNIALAYQGLIKDYGKWLVGAEVAGLGDKNSVKYGVQIDLNL